MSLNERKESILPNTKLFISKDEIIANKNKEIQQLKREIANLKQTINLNKFNSLMEKKKKKQQKQIIKNIIDERNYIKKKLSQLKQIYLKFYEQSKTT